MKARCHRISWSMPALLLLSAGTTMAGTSPPNHTAQTLEGIRNRHHLPALAVVVVKDGKIADRAAVGVRKQGDFTPVTVHDQWHIGSCSKSMTCTLAGMLVEDGPLKWTTTIAEVFLELKGRMDKQYETVTLEQPMWLAPKVDFAVIVATNIGTPQAESQAACDEATRAMIAQCLPK